MYETELEIEAVYTSHPIMQKKESDKWGQDGAGVLNCLQSHVPAAALA